MGVGAGHATGAPSSFDAPEGFALGAMFDAGWWVSPDVTFGVHAGVGAFQDAFDDPNNTPHHSEYRHSYLQGHATFLWHWKRLVAGGGMGLDVARKTLLETDGMSRSETDRSVHLGAHVQVGVDLVRLGPGRLGVFAVGTIEPVQVTGDRSREMSSVIGGLSYHFDR